MLCAGASKSAANPTANPNTTTTTAAATAVAVPIEQRVLHARLLEVEKRVDKNDIRLQLAEDLMRLKKRQTDSAAESEDQRYQLMKQRLAKVEVFIAFFCFFFF